MKEKKEKQVKVHGPATFNIINIILYISFLISLCLSIVDNCRGIISWPVDYEDVI